MVSSDNGRALLPPDPGYPHLAAPGFELPGPGRDPRRGVRAGPQVRPAWCSEAVKRICKS